MLQICTGETMHATCMPSRERPSPSSPQPLAVPPARLTIAAGTATRVRVSTVRVSSIDAGAPTRHVMENEFDLTSLDRPPDASVPIATGAPAGNVMVT